MKYLAVILLLFIICSSCSSFDRMHYRHVRKVPAHFTPFITDPIDSTLSKVHETPIVMPAADSGSIVSVDTIIESDIVLEHGAIGEVPRLKSEESVQQKDHSHEISDSPATTQRRDRSVLVALVFIFIGIILLLYCIFVIPYVNMLLLVLVLEVLVGITAFKLIAKGFSIIRSRIRKPKTYKEAG